MTSPSMLPSPDILNYALSRASLRDYLKIRHIDSLPEPRPFEEVADEWQWTEMYNKVIPAFEWITLSQEERARRVSYQGPTSFWFTYPRGHYKTGTIASLANYLLVFSRRTLPLRISVSAKDKKQAKFVRDAMLRERDLNPWYGKYLHEPHGAINAYDAYGPGGELIINTADAAGAYGGSDDVTICDEVTHWISSDLWVAQRSGAIKRTSSTPGELHQIFFVISNAGYEGTWQHAAWMEARQDHQKQERDPSHRATWYAPYSPGFKSRWMNRDAVEMMRNEITKASGNANEAARLIDNLWISSRTGSVFSAEDVMAMFTESALPQMIFM